MDANNEVIENFEAEELVTQDAPMVDHSEDSVELVEPTEVEVQEESGE